MECPHCKQEISGKKCQDCGAESPLDSIYCTQCGSLLEVISDTMSDEAEGLDFENRVLCPDGTCTGIIVDGKCTYCGKPAT